MGEGKGAILTDADGKEYIDGLAGLWNVVAGHGRIELADAAANQMETTCVLLRLCGKFQLPAIELAERLDRLTYPDHHAVLFHVRRWGSQRHGLQNRPLLLEAERQAG